jgi:hypothetical protein
MLQRKIEVLQQERDDALSGREPKQEIHTQTHIETQTWSGSALKPDIQTQIQKEACSDSGLESDASIQNQKRTVPGDESESEIFIEVETLKVRFMYVCVHVCKRSERNRILEMSGFSRYACMHACWYACSDFERI